MSSCNPAKETAWCGVDESQPRPWLRLFLVTKAWVPSRVFYSILSGEGVPRSGLNKYAVCYVSTRLLRLHAAWKALLVKRHQIRPPWDSNKKPWHSPVVAPQPRPQLRTSGKSARRCIVNRFSGSLPPPQSCRTEKQGSRDPGLSC